MNPVPCFLYDPRGFNLSNGKLADLAPTILKLMGIVIPAVMDGNPLI
jgi:2,3-bisphosphoglycerate-independent phosphoglycerate mutase